MGTATLEAPAGPGLVFGQGYKGAMEEIYLKNVSAEHRRAYLYADRDRQMGTFLIDLLAPAGRQLFAGAISAVLRHADISAVQYDGFEKL